ncbi:hypothetical protein AGMMS49975_15740 [Clostridia bacterium]|nr:hypothetical protein AGMMS49975_15740 [Clostridia bacterium]
MATSTFYEDIIIDDKAADIIIKGLNSPKHPRPKIYIDEIMREGREALKRHELSILSKSANPRQN